MGRHPAHPWLAHASNPDLADAVNTNTDVSEGRRLLPCHCSTGGGVANSNQPQATPGQQVKLTDLVVLLPYELAAVRVIAVRRQPGVGDHNGLQVEPAVCHKHQGVTRVCQHRCCAPQHLACSRNRVQGTVSEER